MAYYKFLYQRKGKLVSQHGRQEWVIGQNYSITGVVDGCVNGFHASAEPLDALDHVKGNIIAVVEVAGTTKLYLDKVCAQRMRIARAYRWRRKDNLALAIHAAELELQAWEAANPGDTRPREAVQKAKDYFQDPVGEDDATVGNKATRVLDVSNAYAAYADATDNPAAAAAAYCAYAAAASTYAGNQYAAEAYFMYSCYAAHAAATVNDAVRADCNQWMANRINQLESINGVTR